jgi:Lrp/AsnC family transcriptional regulator for asnA, asnC and gidA
VRKKDPEVVENCNNGNRRETRSSQRNPLRTPNLAAMLSGMAAAPRRPGPIDDTSKRIIEQLQADGRRPYGEIGKAVGLSEAAVRQRVQKLTETGVMQIVAVTDPMQLGFHRQAMIGIRVSGDTRTVADALEQLPAVDYLVMTAGSFDLMVEVVCEDDDDLIELLNGTIRAIPGVAGTETFVYLQLRKQLYDWGTR